MESNYDKMCRTCMCEGQNMFPLFPVAKDDPDFSDMIMTLTTVRVFEKDGFPCQVCMQCVTALDSAFNFKKLCEKSDVLFRQNVPKSSIEPCIVKVEVNDASCESPTMDHMHDYEEDYLMLKAEPEIELSEEKVEVIEETERKTRSKSNKTTAKPVKPPPPAKAHACTFCGKSYMGSKSLKRHMAVHRGEGVHCSHCEKVFARRDHLRKHLQRVHSVKDIETAMNEISVKVQVKYDCQYCGVDAPNKSSMNKHMRACHKDKLPKRKNSASHYGFNVSDNSDDDAEDAPIAYEENEENSIVAGGAVATIKEELPQEGEGSASRLVLQVAYKCAICRVQYDNQHSYAAHMTKHSKPSPKGQTHFRCSLCDKVFAKRKNLKQHALTHNKEKANKCTLCHRAFTRPDQLILHMNNHTGKKRHQCPHCEKGFNMLSTLKDHLRTHSGEKPYLCSICGKGFTQNTNLKQHLMRHSSTKPFGCPTCHARFVSKGELDAHLRKHTGDHPFVCDTCGTGFTTSSSLVKHKRIHSGERPYACDLCPLRFTALGTLKNHRRTHTGEKPFACTHCTRAFAQKSDLVSHIRTHTGERPYVCPTCGAPYQQSSALKAHIKIHHPNADKMTVTVVVEPQLLPLRTSENATESDAFKPLSDTNLHKANPESDSDRAAALFKTFPERESALFKNTAQQEMFKATPESSQSPTFSNAEAADSNNYSMDSNNL